MTTHEAIDWVNYHSARFSDFSKSYAGLNKEAKHYAMEHICEVLSDYSLREAKVASDIMFNFETPPRASNMLKKLVDILKSQRSKQFPSGEKKEIFCQVCRDTGFAPFYVGSVPDWRKEHLERYRLPSCLWNKCTTNCFCAASKEPQRLLEKHYEKFVSGWLHKCEMTEAQIEAIEHGVLLVHEVEWATSPEDF